MDAKEMVLLSSVLHLPAGITLTSVHPSATELVVKVGCQTPQMECPVCHQSSTRIHGQYQRTVADLPCAGRTVILLLTVRKFVCPTPTCPCKIFTERLPGLVESYARMTGRLIALVQALGMACGGQLGARLATRLGIVTSPSTVLRHLMRLPAPAARAVRMLGIDDFAWKKRFRYGTVLVDLERRTIIDVLPDRESATVERWLREHPEVEVISRDRGRTFAKLRPSLPPKPSRWSTGSISCATWPKPFKSSWGTAVRTFARPRVPHLCRSQAHVRFLLSRPGSSELLRRWKKPIWPGKLAGTIAIAR